MIGYRRGGIVAALWALGVIATAGTAIAQPSQAQIGAVKSNCRSDYMRHCSSVTPGGPEALNCLQSHSPQLSGACRAAVDALKPPPAAEAPAPRPTPAAAPAAAPAPAPERTAAPPPAAAPAKQPVRTATPSAAPAAAPRQPTPQQQAAIRQSCQSDFMSRCRGVQPGGVEALQCLQRNSSQLSPGCRSAVAALGGGGAPAATPASATVAAPPPQEFVYTPMPPLLPRVQLGIIRACDGDRQAVCSMVPLGGGRVIDCLARNEPSLSPFCRQTLTAARASGGR